MKKINLAVIGYGGMGGGFHAAKALNSDVVNLCGIYDIKSERLQAAEDAGIHAYSSFEAVLNDPQVELVTIATPNHVHKDLTVRALDAGKHVICEKPVALSVAELQEMIDAAKRNDRIFTVHQNRRWDADSLLIKQLATSGELGEMISVESRYHGSRGIPGDWRGKEEFGGGMLYDWGIHLIDQVMLFVPEKVVNVYCRFDHITNKEVDDGFKLILTFESGKEALVEVGTCNFLSLPRFFLRCKGGSALIPDWRSDCQVVKCNRWLEKNVQPVRTAAGLTKTMAPRNQETTESYTIPEPQSDVHDFYRNVCKAIRGDEPQLIRHEELIRVMQVIEAAFTSAKSGQAVTCEI